MSTIINSISILKSDGLAITRPLLVQLRSAYLDRAPDISFLDPEWVLRCCEEYRGLLFVNEIWWQSEGSGYSFDLFKQLLVKFMGSADLLILWDGYDPSGLRLDNGVVTQHKVISAIGEQLP